MKMKMFEHRPFLSEAAQLTTIPADTTTTLTQGKCSRG